MADSFQRSKKNAGMTDPFRRSERGQQTRWDGECCRCGQKRRMSHSAHYSLWQQLADNGIADKKAVGWNAEAAVAENKGAAAQKAVNRDLQGTGQQRKNR